MEGQKTLKVESDNESMDGESYPLILDLNWESKFDGLGLTLFLMIEVFEPSLRLKPSIPSFFSSYQSSTRKEELVVVITCNAMEIRDPMKMETEKTEN